MHPFTTIYQQSALPKLKEQKSYLSSYAIPRISKVSVNMGIGDLGGNGKAVEDAAALLSSITGQKVVETKARKAIAGFKIRKGMVVGLKVTLRGERMNDFLLKLSQIALPRTRDFRGLPESGITADGNLNIGIKDSMIFPEAATSTVSHGFQITVVSNANSQEEARTLYEALSFVFQHKENN